MNKTKTILLCTMLTSAFSLFSIEPDQEWEKTVILENDELASTQILLQHIKGESKSVSTSFWGLKNNFKTIETEDSILLNGKAVKTLTFTFTKDFPNDYQGFSFFQNGETTSTLLRARNNNKILLVKIKNGGIYTKEINRYSKPKVKRNCIWAWLVNRFIQPK